jgi:hypothetical protein
MVRDGRVAGEEGGRLTIAVAGAFQRQKLSEPANAGIVAGAITEVLGRPVTVAFVVSEQPAIPAEPAAQAQRTGLSIEEAIALSKQKLDARLVDDQK